MDKKLINVGTEDYSLWVPGGLPVAVYGLETPAVDDMNNLIMLKTRIAYHDGSGSRYDSPLPPSQVIKLFENSNSDIE